MVTIILTIVLVLITLGLVFIGNYKFLETTYSESDRFGDKSVSIKINYKLIVGFVLALLVIIFQPYSIERIDAGAVGLIENKVGNDRGVGSVKYASGYQFYNTYTEAIHEVQTDTKPVDYGISSITAKGGLGCPIHLTFSIKAKPESANLLFVETRQTFKLGGLDAVINSWAKTAIMGGVNHVVNRYDPDYIFSNITPLEEAIVMEVNKRLGKYFEITQMRTNISPPKSMVSLISDKARTVQETQNAELNAVKAVALNKKKVADAQGDYDAALLQAKTKDVLSQPKMLELYRAETERIWAEKGNSPYGENNVFLANPNSILLNKK